MPGGSCLALTVPINLRSNHLPISISEKEGMEGSTFYFSRTYVPLPQIEHTEARKHCADCNKPTHLSWRSNCLDQNGRVIHDTEPHNRYVLCQGCAKRRGGRYAEAIQRYVKK